jgi:hypothetical protein
MIDRYRIALERRSSSDVKWTGPVRECVEVKEYVAIKFHGHTQDDDANDVHHETWFYL